MLAFKSENKCAKKTNTKSTNNDINFSTKLILKKSLNFICKFKYLCLKKSPDFAGKNKLYVYVITVVL